jgi:hypothetical protein
MPALDSVSTFAARPRRRKRPPVVVRVHTPTPDQADRMRSPARRARDRRAVNRTIAHVQARARVTPDQADRNRSRIQQAQDRAAVAKSVRESRERYLSKRGRGAGVRQIKRELEGRGVVADALSKLGKRSVRRLSIDPVLQGVVPEVPNNLGTRAFKDVLNAPAQAAPSLYVPAAGVVEFLRGHPERIKQFGKDISKSDPIYNLAAAGIDAAKGNKKAGERFERFKKSASEHPGFLVLEATAARGVVGRGAGGAVRTTGKVTGSKTLKRIGSTERAPKRLKRTNVVEHTAYSKDLIRKGVQVYQDKTARRRAAELREQAKHEENPTERAKLKAQARRHDPTRIDDKDIQKRVDEHVAITEDVRRTNQARVLAQENKAHKQAKKGGPVVSLLAQRIVRPTLQSMTRYREDLLKVQGDLKGSRLRANQQLVHDLDQALAKIKSGELTIGQLKKIADRYAERSVGSQAGLTARGIYAPEQSERRAVEPFAIRELGAHRDPDYLKAIEKATKNTAKQTGKTAARARGRTLRARQTHKAQSAQAQARLKAHEGLPVPAWARKNMEAKAARESAAREAQIRRSSKRAERTGTAARTAAAKAADAKALRRADPLLVKAGATSKRKIETDEIRAALAKIHGKDAKAAVVSQRPAHEASGGDFYPNAGNRPAKGETRTLGGGATREGTLDASADRLLRQHVRAQALQDAHDSYNDFIEQFARREKGGERKVEHYADATAATEKVNDLNAKGDVQWRVVRVDPFKGSEHREIFEGEDPTGVEARTFEGALKGQGEGKYAIVPEAAAKQMQAHMDLLSPNNAARGLRSASSAFRRSALASSLPWMVGNVSEAGLRSAINKVTPLSYIRGHRILRAIDRLDDQGAQRAKARLVGGGHYAFADRKIHANLDAYAEGFVKDVTSNWHKIRQTKGVQALPWLWDRWTHHTFNTVNKTIEQQFQTAMLGKAAKEKLMPDSLRATSRKAIEEMAHGVIKPNTAAALKREIDRMYGRYQGFSPGERFLLANYTPFGAWTRNAAELLATMPERHPTTTLAGTAAVNATEDWRQKQGLDIMGPGAMKGWLQGSLPLPGGAHLRLTRFTPMALATDLPGTLASAVMPQFSAVLDALEGRSWTGAQLRNKKGELAQDDEKIKAALVAFMDATIPLLSVGKRIAEKGPMTVPQSAVGYTPPGKKKAGASSPPRKGGFGSAASSYGSGYTSSSSRFKSSFK